MNTGTHTLFGGIIGLSLAMITGNTSLVLIGFLGGTLPDIDMLLRGHRKTLHFPVYFNLLATVLFIFYISGSGFLLVPALFFAAAGLHSFMDIYAGAELRSWDRSEWREKAVYNHWKDKWYKPKRTAPGGTATDLLLSLAAGSILAIFTRGTTQILSFTLLVFSGLYFLFVRKIGDMIPDRFDTLNSFILFQIKSLKTRIGLKDELHLPAGG